MPCDKDHFGFILLIYYNSKKAVLVNYTSDDQIIGHIREGGRNRELATDHLMKEHLGFVHKFMNTLFLSEQVALDCYIDALADVVEQVSTGSFKGKSKISTYLYQIAYFRCVDELRKNKNEFATDNEFPEMEDLSQKVSKKIEIEYEIKKLKKYLHKMGSPCNGILMDWAFWGYNMNEIAERNGLSSAAIAKSRKYQCLQKLRQLIGIN